MPTSLLFDTNALIYWLYPSSPFHEEVAELIMQAELGGCTLYALTSSLNDVYFTLKRNYLTEKEARESVRDIAESFDLVDLAGPFVFQAIDSNEPDYEDALIRAAAEALQVDVLVSYDKAAFKKSFIPKVTGSEALSLLSQVGSDA